MAKKSKDRSQRAAQGHRRSLQREAYCAEEDPDRRERYPRGARSSTRGTAEAARNASPVRVRNRDQIDGRPRGTFQKFGISRVRFREMAHRGELPGITKSSW